VNFNIQNVLILPTDYIYVYFMVLSAMILSLCRIDMLVLKPRRRVFTLQHELHL